MRIPSTFGRASMSTGGIGAPAQQNLLKRVIVAVAGPTAPHRSATKGEDAMLKLTLLLAHDLQRPTGPPRRPATRWWN